MCKMLLSTMPHAYGHRLDIYSHAFSTPQISMFYFKLWSEQQYAYYPHGMAERVSTGCAAAMLCSVLTTDTTDVTQY